MSDDLDRHGDNGPSRVVYSENFTTEPGTADAYGHGTLVASITAGNGANSGKRIVGIAPGQTSSTLAPRDSWMISAMDRAIQLNSTYNIKVLNISLRRPVFEPYTQDPLCQAVERAWSAGIVVVAAGNEGRNNSVGNNRYGTIASPANDPLVITVGAMRHIETITRTWGSNAVWGNNSTAGYNGRVGRSQRCMGQ